LSDLSIAGTKSNVRNLLPYLGPSYTDAEVLSAIESTDSVRIVSNKLSKTIKIAARLIAEGKVIGWFQGRSEVGPRALGNRSILADPRKPYMRSYINQQVKHREWYRPVSPAVLESAAPNYFRLDRPLPFMLFSVQAKPGRISDIPSVVHVDGSARVQTVNEIKNARFFSLISEFDRITGVPMVINTSFNDRGEPIVESPRDALRAFCSMHLDALVLDKYLVVKKGVGC